MKKVLVIHYSQSGQLTKVARRFCQPLVDAKEVDVTFERVQLVEDYPFPWSFFRFLDTFPEAVYLDPPPLRPSTLTGEEEFDLIVVAYQVWFLSPSLPITGFMQSAVAKKLFGGKPVVTLIACRDMWLMAQEQMKLMLTGLGAHLVGNVALVDAAGTLGSFFATPVWVLSGKKGPHLGGIIPRAGVSPENIARCDRFGHRIAEVFSAEQEIETTLLSGLGAVHVKDKLISSEKLARRSFLIWGRLLRSIGKSGASGRKPVLIIYAMFLVTFLLTFVPLSMLVKKVLAPLTRQHVAEQKAYFRRPSGS